MLRSVNPIQPQESIALLEVRPKKTSFLKVMCYLNMSPVMGITMSGMDMLLIQWRGRKTRATLKETTPVN